MCAYDWSNIADHIILSTATAFAKFMSTNRNAALVKNILHRVNHELILPVIDIPGTFQAKFSSAASVGESRKAGNSKSMLGTKGV